MATTASYLERLGDWAEKQNEKDEAKSAVRPTWWHVGKLLLGTMLAVRGVAIAAHAAGPARYALAILFLVGGVSMALDASTMLRRRLARR